MDSIVPVVAPPARAPSSDDRPTDRPTDRGTTPTLSVRPVVTQREKHPGV
jgi:hypothetical protein